MNTLKFADLALVRVFLTPYTFDRRFPDPIFFYRDLASSKLDLQEKLFLKPCSHPCTTSSMALRELCFRNKPLTLFNINFWLLIYLFLTLIVCFYCFQRGSAQAY